MTNDNTVRHDRIEELEQRIDELEEKSGPQSLATTRRTVMGALGGGALLAGASGTAAASTNVEGVTFVGQGDKIQDAVDSTTYGLIFVTSEYDSSYETDWPITFDTTADQCTIMGDGMTKITAPSDENVFEIDTNGSRPNEVTLDNLAINGGIHGVKIHDTSHVTLSNLDIRYVGKNGIFVQSAESGPGASNSLNILNTTIQNAGESGSGDGIHIQRRAHGTNLFGVRAIKCAGTGLHLQDSVGITLVGCQAEDCREFGIRLYNINGGFMYGTYLEKNHTNGVDPNNENNAEVDLYGCSLVTIEGMYAKPHEVTGSVIYAKNCNTVDVRAVSTAWYNDGATDSPDHTYSSIIDGTGVNVVDCHRPSHYPNDYDGTQPSIISGTGIANRVRTDGVVIDSDLSTTSGAYDGDVGIDDYNGSPQMKVWNGSSWN